MGERESRTNLTAVDLTRAAFASYQKSIEASIAQTEALKNALGGLAGAATLGAFGMMMKGAFDSFVEGAAKLEDLAMKAGTTVQWLSGLAPVAKIAGISLEDVAAAGAKLAKGLAAAGDMTKGTGLALAHLGISARDSNGNLRDTGDVMDDIAKKLALVENPAAKSAEAIAIFGKNGATMLPLLKEMADSGERVGKVTQQQAALARDYEKDLIRLSTAQAQIGKIISAEVLPIADAFVKALTEMSNKTGGLRDQTKALAADGSIRAWAINAVEFLAFLMNAADGVVRVFNLMGMQIGYVLAQAASAFKGIGGAIIDFIEGNYKQAWGDLASASDRASAMTVAHLTAIQDVLNKPMAGDTFLETFKTKLAEVDAKLQSAAKAAGTAGGDFSSVAGAAAASMGKLIAAHTALSVAIVKGQEAIDKQRDAVSLKTLDEAYAEHTITVKQFYDQKASLLNQSLDREQNVSRSLIGIYNDEIKALDALSGTVKQLVGAEAQKQGVQKQIAAEQDKIRSAEEKRNEVQLLSIEGQRKYNEELEKSLDPYVKQALAIQDQIHYLGLSKEQIDLRKIAEQDAAIATLEVISAIEGELPVLTQLIEKLKAQREIMVGIAQSDVFLKTLQDQVAVWDDLANRAGKFFGDLVMNGKSAFDNLKKELHSFLQELIALVAKKWVLNIAASTLTGTEAGTALAAQAATAGNGSIAGSVLSTGASLLGNSAVGAAAGEFWGGVTGTFMGPIAEGTTAAGLGSTIGSAIAAIPVWGWIVAAIAAVAYAIRDKGENWQAQVGFGANAQAYATQGVFGPEGFHNIAGDDRLNSAIQAFMASTSKIDTVLAQHLTTTQISTISGNLQSESMRQFAFPRGDDTAGQQLTLEYLQKKYGVIFDQIDTTFATFIRSYSGKSEDLVKEIANFAALMDSLGKSGLKGLNVESLRAFQNSGEALGDTFTRVMGEYGKFVASFTSSSDQLTAAQDAVSQTFGALGLAIPASDKAYRDLVAGLDLSSAAGRNTFAVLLQLAPAFQQVSQAAAQMLSSFQQSLATLFGATYTQGQQQQAILAQIEQLRQMVPAIANLGSAGQILTGLVNVDATSLQAVYDMLASNPAAQALYAQIIQLYAAMHTATTTTGGLTTGIAGLGGTASNAASQLQAAQDALKAYMNGLLLNTALSPLTPQQRLAQAQQQYQNTLGLAQGGDVNAIQGLGGSADAYLTIARQIFASGSAYNAIFQTVFGQLGSVAGPGAPTWQQAFISAMPPAGATLASSIDIRQSADRIETAVHTLILAIGNGVPVNDPQNAQMLEDLRVEVRKNTSSSLA